MEGKYMAREGCLWVCSKRLLGLIVAAVFMGCGEGGAADGSAQSGAAAEGEMGNVPQAIGGRFYNIIAVHSGKCMDVSGIRQDNGAPIIQWSCWGGQNQSFFLQPHSDGTFSLIAQHSGKCVDVSNVSTANGAPIIQWDCWGGNNQRFYVQEWGGNYRFVAKHSGKCLDVEGFGTADGVRLIQWDCHGGPNQAFRLP